jgi:hypothetical protein
MDAIVGIEQQRAARDNEQPARRGLILRGLWRQTANLCMKKYAFFGLIVALLTGCSWSVGSSPKTSNVLPTTGQQLIDLQKARDSGAITDAEYQAQKAKALGNK